MKSTFYSKKIKTHVPWMRSSADSHLTSLTKAFTVHTLSGQDCSRKPIPHLSPPPLLLLWYLQFVFANDRSHDHVPLYSFSHKSLLIMSLVGLFLPWCQHSSGPMTVCWPDASSHSYSVFTCSVCFSSDTICMRKRRKRSSRQSSFWSTLLFFIFSLFWLSFF